MSMFPLASFTAGAGGLVSVTFSNIPQNYRHLELRAFAKSNASIGGYDQMMWRFNNDGTANAYSQTAMEGTGTSTVSCFSSGLAYTYGFGGRLTDGTQNPFGASIITFYDYSSTVKNKSWISLQGAELNGTARVGVYSGFWNNTSAITSIVLQPQTAGAFGQHSRFDLYGIG